MYYDEMTGITFKYPCKFYKLCNYFKSLILEFMGSEFTIAEMEFMRKEAIQSFLMAKNYALTGDRYMVEVNISQIKKIQKRVHVNVNIDDIVIDPQLEKKYLVTTIDFYFNQLENAVRLNNKNDIDWYNTLIKRYTLKLNQNILKRIENILQLPHDDLNDEAEHLIQNAEKFAGKGDETMMNYYIKLATDSTLTLTLPMKKRIASMTVDPNVKKSFIQNEIQTIYQQAMNSAKKGDLKLMEYNIHSLISNGKEIDEDVLDRINEIKQAYHEFKYSKSF